MKETAIVRNEIDLHKDIIGSIRRVQPIYFHLTVAHIYPFHFGVFANVIGFLNIYSFLLILMV